MGDTGTAGRRRRARRRTAIGLGTAVLLTACSGTPPGSRDEPSPPARTFDARAVGGKDPARQGPAPEVPGTQRGGTITTYLPGAPGPDSLDPTAGWSAVGNAILQSLVSRSLTQLVRGPDGEPVLVPDLATDLGTPNADFTRWTFTLRDDATWQDGTPVTPQDVAFGICRSLDSETFPAGPGTEYSVGYFAGADDYAGPYTGNDPRCEDWDGVSVRGQELTIEMSRPFPDMDHWGAVMAMGPAPAGRASDPVRYASRPMATGPYQVQRWVPGEELVLVRNEAWDPDSDPGRHQYADRFVFRFSQDQAKVDEIMLSGAPRGEAAVATSVGSDRYVEANRDLGDRLVQQPTQCVATMTPDNRTITDIRVRKALAYAFPYYDVWLAAGEVPGVTRDYAGSLMPPGMPGRRVVEVDGEQITYDPDRARALLREAGYGAQRPFRVTMAYDETDRLVSAAQAQLTKGLEAGGFEVRSIPVQENIYSVWLDPTNPVNRRLNLRGVTWCPAWPGGSALLPPILGAGEPFNTAHFDDPDTEAAMDAIAELPVGRQAAAWGRLDQQIMTDHFPLVPTGYVNELLVFGERIGNPSGEGAMGAPNYRDLFVVP